MPINEEDTIPLPKNYRPAKAPTEKPKVNIDIKVDRESKTVVVLFDHELNRIGFSYEDALGFAHLLKQKAKEVKW